MDSQSEFSDMQPPLLDFLEAALKSADISPDWIERIEAGPDKDPGVRIHVDDWEFDIHISRIGLIS